MDTLSLTNKTVIVTGGAQGIGPRLATGLARAGAKITIADVLNGQAVAKQICDNGGQAIAVTTDITDDASLKIMVEETEKAHGSANVLVNNAAIFGKLPITPMEEIDYDEWDQVMRVNVRGVLQSIKAVLPGMEKQQSGSIINISTNRIYTGYAGLLHYDASKGAVASMTRAMAAELGDRKIRVNAIAPGLTMSENVMAKEGIAQRNAAAVKNRALQKSLEPEDIIGAVLFFASDQSAYISGQSLIVDGGGIMV